MRLVLGLGNPGPVYAATRHNVGFMVLDRLGVGAPRRELPFPGIVAERADGLLLAKPNTYMNRSGAAVERLLELGLQPDELLVVFDDLDLELGQLRLKPNGGAGTHNGMRDIVERCGRDIPRLRLGIGPPPEDCHLADWVTGDFSTDEAPIAESMIQRSVTVIEALLDEPWDRVVGKTNRRWEPELEGDADPEGQD